MQLGWVSQLGLINSLESAVASYYRIQGNDWSVKYCCVYSAWGPSVKTKNLIKPIKRFIIIRPIFWDSPASLARPKSRSISSHSQNLIKSAMGGRCFSRDLFECIRGVLLLQCFPSFLTTLQSVFPRTPYVKINEKVSLRFIQFSAFSEYSDWFLQLSAKRLCIEKKITLLMELLHFVLETWDLSKKGELSTLQHVLTENNPKLFSKTNLAIL